MPRQKTQAYISRRRAINLVGPSSRISAFWRGSAAVTEVWGQAEGSSGRHLQPVAAQSPPLLPASQGTSCVSYQEERLPKGQKGAGGTIITL